MGKNKPKNHPKKKQAGEPRAKKDLSVFKVAGSKVGKLKNRAKPVTTSLKKLDRKSHTDAKIDQANAAFDDVRSSLLKPHQGEAQNKAQVTRKPDPDPGTQPPDMDAAASDFAKL